MKQVKKLHAETGGVISKQIQTRLFIPVGNESGAVLAKPACGWLEHIDECCEGQIP